VPSFAVKRPFRYATYETLNGLRDLIDGVLDLWVKVRKPCSTRAQPIPKRSICAWGRSPVRAGLQIAAARLAGRIVSPRTGGEKSGQTCHWTVGREAVHLVGDEAGRS
jgi:hypothetical protein